MAEGTTKSDDARDKEHGKRHPEEHLMQGVVQVFNAIDLAQPEPLDAPEARDIKQAKEGDVEDTPEEAERELEAERQAARNPEHPGEPMSGTL